MVATQNDMIALANYTWSPDMTPETVRRLNQLNQDFYRITAEQFSLTRSNPWEGWQELIAPISDLIKHTDGPLRVLDIGCGNGRFATWLSQTWPTASFEYTGVDFADDLLTYAAELSLPHVQVTTVKLDIVEKLLSHSTLLNKSSFDLVVAFGVLHHIPGEEQRRAFFNVINNHLETNGLAVVSLWQFDQLPQLLDRQTDPTQLDLPELDEGDYILDWQRGVAAYRYCHLVKLREAKKLVTGQNMHITRHFSADGPTHRANIYLEVKKD